MVMMVWVDAAIHHNGIYVHSLHSIIPTDVGERERERVWMFASIYFHFALDSGWIRGFYWNCFTIDLLLRLFNVPLLLFVLLLNELLLDELYEGLVLTYCLSKKLPVFGMHLTFARTNTSSASFIQDEYTWFQNVHCTMNHCVWIHFHCLVYF